MSDNVCHPSHYTQGSIECIDAIKAATVGKTGIEAVCVANAIKYLWRYEEKNGLEDVKKAKWYIERLISELDTDINKNRELDNINYGDCETCRYDGYEETEYPCVACCNCYAIETKAFYTNPNRWCQKV